MKVFHRTWAATAAKILTGGFKDARGTYLTFGVHTGVWVSDVPLDCNEGADGDVVLSLHIDEAALLPHEWVGSMGYREFLTPAQVLNGHRPFTVEGADLTLQGTAPELWDSMIARLESSGHDHLRKLAARRRELRAFLQEFAPFLGAEPVSAE